MATIVVPAPPAPALVATRGPFVVVSRPKERIPMSVKSILLTAGVALVVVVAYDKSKAKIPALRTGV